MRSYVINLFFSLILSLTTGVRVTIVSVTTVQESDTVPSLSDPLPPRSNLAQGYFGKLPGRSRGSYLPLRVARSV